MSRAAALRPSGVGAGSVIAMLVILILALPFLLLVAIIITIARGGEYVPRFIHWMGRKARQPWAQ